MSFLFFCFLSLPLFVFLSFSVHSAPVPRPNGFIAFPELETPSEGGLFSDFDVQQTTKRNFFPTLGHGGKCEHGKGDCFLEVPPTVPGLNPLSSVPQYTPGAPPLFPSILPSPFSPPPFPPDTVSPKSNTLQSSLPSAFPDAPPLNPPGFKPHIPRQIFPSQSQPQIQPFLVIL